MMLTTPATVALTLGGVGAVLLIYGLIRAKSELKQATERTKELEEKVEWLRKIRAENEYKKEKKITELEKENLQLRHKIETLEQKLKEGGKNQIVAKIESYRSRRKNRLQALSDDT